VSPNPSEPPFDELLEQLKTQLPEPLFATVSKKFLALQYAERKIQVLEERLRLKRIQMYGPGSEKLTNEQLELLELEPGVSTAEVQAESAREPVPGRPAEKRVRQHPGRQALPAELPRVERVIACTAEQCVCGGCGRETTVIGYEESEQLDVEPAKYFVVVTKREKRACKSCEERGVQAAPLPPRIIEKRLVSDCLVIDAVVSKYADHCPLYRQSAMLERDSGVELSRQTLDGWVMRVGEFLVPLAEALRQELLRGSYLQADETPVGVQMHDGNGSNHLVSVAIRAAARGGGVRLPYGAWARRPETFSREFRWSFAKRWICRLRFRGRAEDGARVLLVALETKIRGSGEVESSRCPGGSHCQAYR